jgi:hypothetical protein
MFKGWGEKGSVVPVDRDPDPDGFVKCTKRDGEMYAWTLEPADLAAEKAKGTPLRKLHHATCPKAKSFRGKAR